MRRICVLACCLLGAAVWSAQAAAGEWRIGAYSFSDELGGIRITAVGGEGSDENPYVLVLRQMRAEPVTVVIRPKPVTVPSGRLLRQAFVNFSLLVVITNASNRNWAGMDLELQEVKGKPSIYHDGLSFDQPRSFRNRVFRSDKFARFSDLTEPYDRIRFEQGYVVPMETVSMKVYITDVTPRDEFFLVLDPQILLARAPQNGRARIARIASPRFAD